MRQLLLVFLLLLSVNVQADSIHEPLSGKELLALLDSPDVHLQMAGAYYIYGVLEGHVVSAKRPLEVCILDEPVTVKDLVAVVRNHYMAHPFLLDESVAAKLASADIIIALQRRYPCK
jgi:hypothetical protein